VTYRRPETAAAVTRLEEAAYRTPWLDTWSRDYIRQAFNRAVSVAARRLEPDHVFAAFSEMVTTLAKEPQSRHVIFALGGVCVMQDELQLGDVRIFKMNDNEREKIRSIFHSILKTAKNTDDDKQIIRERLDGMLSSFATLTCAEVPVKGDPELCRLDAAFMIEPIIDFLQLIAEIEQPRSMQIRIQAGGDLLARQPPRIVLADDGTEANYDQKLAFGHRLELTDAHLSRMRERGFGNIIAALVKKEDARSDFEAMLLNGVHWISDAARQERTENRVTSYTTAIELFFAKRGHPVTSTLVESVACLLRGADEERREEAQYVRKLYKSRSRVSHEGERIDSEDAAHPFKILAVNVVAALSQLSEKFKTKADVRNHFSALRKGTVWTK
jgi:hypothetical protein